MIINEDTKRRAQEVYDYILAHPEKHNQAGWYEVNNTDGEFTMNPLSESNFCNTTMCVAGTAIYLDKGVEALLNPGDFYEGCAYSEAGARLLGLNHDSEDAFSPSESDTLFYNMDNELALDMLLAVANGDEEKFKHLGSMVEEV